MGPVSLEESYAYVVILIIMLMTWTQCYKGPKWRKESFNELLDYEFYLLIVLIIGTIAPNFM